MNDQVFELIKGRLDDIANGQDQLHERISEEIKTLINDELSPLKTKVSEIEAWKNKMIGAVGVMGAIILPIVIWIIRYEIIHWRS